VPRPELDREARARDPLRVVAAVQAQVVALTEQPLARLGRDDRGILARMVQLVRDRHREHRPAAGTQDAPDLGERERLVGDVLEHVVCDHDVEVGVGVGERGEVEALEARRPGVELGLEVARFVVDVRARGEVRVEADLGRDMQQAHPRREQVRDARRVQPRESRAAVGSAHRTGPAGAVLPADHVELAQHWQVEALGQVAAHVRTAHRAVVAAPPPEAALQRGAHAVRNAMVEQRAQRTGFGCHRAAYRPLLRAALPAPS
jgi:hypothetical protein